MAEEGADRTEPATLKRRNQAREKGQVARSSEVSPVTALLVLLVFGSFGAPLLLEGGQTLVIRFLSAAGPLAASNDNLGHAILPLMEQSLIEVAMLILPLMLTVAFATGGIVLAQVGWKLTPALLLPDLKRISLKNGLGRLFGVSGAVNLVKAVVKVGCVMYFALRVLRSVDEQAVAAPALEIGDILIF